MGQGVQVHLRPGADGSSVCHKNSFFCRGLTPASAVPALLEAARSGYITACALEEDGTLLRVDCGSPPPRCGRFFCLS